MRSKFFKIHELVPRDLFETIHEDVLWRMIPTEVIETIDRLKETFSNGSMTINNYFWNGEREWSGLRIKGSPFYSSGSQHTVLNAIDAVFSDYTAEDVRSYIMAHQSRFLHITRLEDGVEWLHFDIKETRNSSIVLFRA